MFLVETFVNLSHVLDEYVEKIYICKNSKINYLISEQIIRYIDKSIYDKPLKIKIFNIIVSYILKMKYSIEYIFTSYIKYYPEIISTDRIINSYSNFSMIIANEIIKKVQNFPIVIYKRNLLIENAINYNFIQESNFRKRKRMEETSYKFYISLNLIFEHSREEFKSSYLSLQSVICI